MGILSDASTVGKDGIKVRKTPNRLQNIANLITMFAHLTRKANAGGYVDTEISERLTRNRNESA